MASSQSQTSSGASGALFPMAAGSASAGTAGTSASLAFSSTDESMRGRAQGAHEAPAAGPMRNRTRSSSGQRTVPPLPVRQGPARSQSPMPLHDRTQAASPAATDRSRSGGAHGAAMNGEGRLPTITDGGAQGTAENRVESLSSINRPRGAAAIPIHDKKAGNE